VPARVCSRIAEAVLLHRDATKEQAYDRAADVLDLVGLPRPRERLGECLHESTGGMRQRLMIAMALACEPKLMIAGAGLDLTPARKDRLAGSSSTLTLITVTEFHGCRGVDLQAPWAR